MFFDQRIFWINHNSCSYWTISLQIHVLIDKFEIIWWKQNCGKYILEIRENLQIFKTEKKHLKQKREEAMFQKSNYLERTIKLLVILILQKSNHRKLRSSSGALATERMAHMNLTQLYVAAPVSMLTYFNSFRRRNHLSRSGIIQLLAVIILLHNIRRHIVGLNHIATVFNVHYDTYVNIQIMTVLLNFMTI